MKELFQKHLIIASLWSAVIIILVMASLTLFGLWYDEWSGYNSSVAEEESGGACNVAVLKLFGGVYAYAGEEKDGLSTVDDLPPSINPDDVALFFADVESNPDIIGIIADIDSPGGSGIGGDMIAKMFKRSKTPVVAVIREMGASAGYLIASGAEHIIASPIADVGGIGVTMSYLSNVRQNEYDGLDYIELTSAPYKDYLSSNKSLTEEEYALVMRDLTLYHKYLVETIAENRSLSVDAVKELADGASLPGVLALDAGLIDELGDMENARSWLAKEYGISPDEVIFCEG